MSTPTIKIAVSQADATLVQTCTLTAGMQNLPIVKFSFSDEWAGLGKTAVCRAGSTVLEVLVVNSQITVPVECLETAGVNLIIGVYGTDTAVAIPTVWCSCGEILDGTDVDEPSNVGEATEALVDQMIAYAAEIEGVAETLEENVITEAQAIDTNANQYGTADVDVDLVDASETGKKLVLTFENLKGNGITDIAYSASGEYEGRINIKTDANPSGTNYDALIAPIAYFKNVTNRSQAYAIGTTGEDEEETPVPATDPAYHNNSKYYAEQAASSATTASTSASSAMGYASSASSAKTAAQTAQGKAEDAQAAAEAAATSASTDAGIASGSAEAAAGSAGDALTSAGAAESSAVAASAAQTAAETAQGLAEAAKTGAQGYASTASTAATNAGNSATAASGSANSASGSATSASTNALKAEGFAVGEQNGTAVTSDSPYYENNAAYYAGEASDSADAAEAAQAAAEEVLESIPEDYTELTEEVDDLKTVLNEDEAILSLDTDVDISFTVEGTGYIKYADGTIGSSSATGHTDYVDVSKYAYITYSRTQHTSSPVHGMAFYNANKTYISGVQGYYPVSADHYEDYTTAVPENAVYARFTVYMNTTTYGDFELSGKAKLVATVSEFDEMKAVFEPDVIHLTTSILDPLVDNFPVKGQYIKNSQGQYGNSANWNTTDYIPIESTTVYYLYNVPNTGYFVALYDSSKAIKAYLSAYTGNEIGVTSNSGWRYMRVSMDKDYIPDFDIRKGSVTLYHHAEEAFKKTGITVEVGADKQFTTLRSAWEEVRYIENSTVIVYPGTYDLAQEFATEIANGSANGILLGNGIKFIFLSGSYVTCNLDNTVASHGEFQPFYTPYASSGTQAVYKNSNFTLDGLNMTASNTRYCIHDEMASDARPYVHNYINCQMQYSSTFDNTGVNQCIGGGLGQKGYINIDGGYYNSLTSVSHGAGGQIPISYHNSSSANADNKIFIKNVYLAGTGHLRFGYYGTSQTITPIYVSGCSFGAPIEKRAENDTALVDNFSITEWNNTVRT